MHGCNLEQLVVVTRIVSNFWIAIHWAGGGPVSGKGPEVGLGVAPPTANAVVGVGALFWKDQAQAREAYSRRCFRAAGSSCRFGAPTLIGQLPPLGRNTILESPGPRTAKLTAAGIFAPPGSSCRFGAPTPIVEISVQSARPSARGGPVSGMWARPAANPGIPQIFHTLVTTLIGIRCIFYMPFPESDQEPNKNRHKIIVKLGKWYLTHT